MELKKLAPWNWFKKEEESAVPIERPWSREGGSDQRLFPSRWGYRDEIDRLFHQFLHEPFGSIIPRTPLETVGLLKPLLDLHAEDKEYILTIEIPGVDEKDITLTVLDNTLTVKGEKKQEKEVKRDRYYRLERNYGSFQRVLSLPEDVDQDNIQAVYKKGVLTITMPRTETFTPAAKSITIKP